LLQYAGLMNTPNAPPPVQPGTRWLVLLCTHNGADYLPAQLQSLLDQTQRPQVLEVHDWGSSDNTVGILRRFAQDNAPALDVRLHLHPQAPGPCASFLHALRHTLASRDDFDFLLLCDQDDIWHSDKVACFARLLRQQPQLDLIASDVALIDCDGAMTAASSIGPRGVLARRFDLQSPATLLANVVPGMAIGVSRRLLVKGSAAWAEPHWVMHDWALCIVAHLLQADAAWLPRALVHYRQHGHNWVGTDGLPRQRWQLPLARSRKWVPVVQAQYRHCLARAPSWALPMPRTLGRWGAARALLQARTYRGLKGLVSAVGFAIFWRG
jgi:Glycosyl transferase family 2